MRLRHLFYYLIVTACCMVPTAASADAPASDVLRKYVERKDDSYAWSVRQTSQLGKCRVTELTLNSQTWRGMLWQHRLFVAVPEGDSLESEAMLVIGGGSWKDEYAQAPKDEPSPLPKEAALLAMYAQQLNCPVAILLNVPRQPIFDGRKEDAIIALTFDEYLKTGDTDWPLLLPMVKSAVRAMDAVQAFAAEKLDLKISRFTVTGASKRGWTTWLTAAVDDRVQALAPMVIDMLNMEAQFDHQLAAYGKFSARIHDYTDRDLPRRMRGEPGAALRTIVDPYSYRDQIDQPKMLFLGTNDGFWTLDALNLYWNDLKGEKYVVYVPNADHDLAMDWRRIMGGLRALHRQAVGREKLPRLEWDFQPVQSSRNLSLVVRPGGAGASIALWTARSETRDFRDAKWDSSVVPLDQDGSAHVSLEAPANGYQAYYAEISYGGPSLLPLRLCTTIRVIGPHAR